MAKTVGITLVVLAHAIPKEYALWQIINQFHMPLFYFLSGYLYRSRDHFNNYVLKKIHSLYVPYILNVSSVYFLMVLFGKEQLALNTIIKILLMQYNGCLMGAVWFIGVLFYALVSFDAVRRVVAICTKESRNSELLLALVCCFILIVGLNSHFPLRVSNIMVAMAFIELGRIVYLSGCIFKKIPVALGTLMLIIMSLIGRMNFVSVSQNSYSSKTLFLIAAVLGVFGVCTLCYRLINTYGLFFNGRFGRQCSFISQNSICVVIWQFWAFKPIMLLQILYYECPVKLLSSFPVIYEYTSVPWVTLLCISGIFLSICWYRLIENISKRALNACMTMFLSAINWR